MKNSLDSLTSLEQNFEDLIIRRCKFCELDKNPDFKFPEITEDLLNSGSQSFISVPRMFGGFAYYLEEVDGRPVLYAEQSSRMDHSSDDYLYFVITENESRILEGEERETAQKKFRELVKKAHEEHMRKLKEASESE